MVIRSLHVVSSLMTGGMEHFVLRLAAEQRRAGHDARVLAVRDGPLRAEAERLGVPLFVPSGGRLGRVLGTAVLLMRLRPRILHAHNPAALRFAILGKRLVGARVVLTRHGQLLDWTPTASEDASLDAVVAVSGASESALRERAPALGPRLVVIRNGVSPVPPERRREEVRAGLQLGPETVAGIVVARMDGRKGHAAMLEALARAPSSVVLLFAGDGDERPALDARAREIGVGDRVRFLGFRSDVPDLLSAADFLALASEAEGMPLSILEGMAAGLPVLATPVGGVPEAVRDGVDGLLVPLGDMDALAAAMTRLAEDAALRCAMGAAGRRRVAEEFSFEEMARRYEVLYRQIL